MFEFGMSNLMYLKQIVNYLRIKLSVLKRTVWKDRYEIIYVGPNQILVKPLKSDGRETTVSTNYGGEIEDVRIMGKDNYLVARTATTLIVVDLQRNLQSEVKYEVIL